MTSGLLKPFVITKSLFYVGIVPNMFVPGNSHRTYGKMDKPSKTCITVTKTLTKQ